MVVAGLDGGGQGGREAPIFAMGKGKGMPEECLRFEDNNSLMCEFPGSVESNL